MGILTEVAPSLEVARKTERQKKKAMGKLDPIKAIPKYQTQVVHID